MRQTTKIIVLTLLAVNAVVAQPKLTLRAQRTYPTALPVEDDDVEWQRDVYRQIGIDDERNTALFVHDQNDATQRTLFDIIFSKVLDGEITAYRYELEGNETYTYENELNVQDVLDDHSIPYERVGNHLNVRSDDFPTSEITMYYIKEGVYYDITNSAFRTRVLSICPVIVTADDEFGEGETNYPLFWIKYQDLVPHIKNIRIVPESRNSHGLINLTDYFTLNRYRGPIYKVYNARGWTLAQYCENDSAVWLEQQRIADEIDRVQHNTYDTYPAIRKAPAAPGKKRRKVRIFGLTIGREDKNDNGQ